MDKKPLFIHIPKTGGLALKKSLRFNSVKVETTSEMMVSNLPPETKEIVKELVRLPVGYHHGYHHLRYRDVECEEVEKTFQPFAIVRNPWSRLYSFWTYFDLRCKMTPFPNRMRVPKTFEEFVEERDNYVPVSYKSNWLFSIRNWVIQKEYVIDGAGELPLDILRFEHYSEDLKAYLNMERIRRVNVSSRGHPPYKEAYTEDLIQAVADWYKDDIDYFGFDFDTSATKNIWSS